MATNSLLSTKYNTIVNSGAGKTKTDLGNVINSTNVETVNLNFSNPTQNFNINYPPNSKVAIYDSNIIPQSQQNNNSLLVNNNNAILPGVKIDPSINLKSSSTSLIPSKSGLIFAGGKNNTTGCVMAVSKDGFYWDQLDFSFFYGAVNFIRYNGIIYLAGGGAGATSSDTLAYSYDGYSWYGLGKLIGSYANDAAWNGYMWIVVGYGSGTTDYGSNNIIYSYDGINWTGLGRSALLFGSTSVLYGGNAIAWNGYMWIAVGTAGSSAMIYSYDGFNWNIPGYIPFSIGGSAIAWNGYMWVAGGGGGSATTAFNVGYSYNGINWTSFNTFLAGDYTTTFAGGINTIGWNGTYWLAGGRNVTGTNTCTLIYSYDGIDWAAINNVVGTSNAQTQIVFSLIYTGTYWLGGFYNNSGNYTTMGYAPPEFTYGWGTGVGGTDKSWTINATNGTNGIGVGGLGNSLEIFSERVSCLSLIDKVTHYISTVSPVLFAGGTGPGVNRYGTSIAYAPIIATGAGAPLAWKQTATGSTGSTKNIFNLTCNKVAFNGNTFLAVGGTGPSSIAYSNNGVIWNELVNSSYNTFLSGNDVVWNGDMWVAGGLTGPSTLAYSNDGFTWYGCSGAIFSSECKSIAYSNTMWMACGVTGPTNNSTMSYSIDGINWNGITGSKLSIICNSSYWNGFMWVAVGSGTNTIAYSYDGLNWNGLGANIFTTAGNDVAWNGTMWVAVGRGTNSFAYSYDGINWNGLGTSIFTISGISLTWNGNTWIAIGSGGSNKVAYSNDGIKWYGMGTNNADYGFTGGISATGSSNKISWTQNIPTVFIQQPTLAFGGTGSTILYSPDGVNWNGLGNTIFTNEGRGGAWNGRIWVAVGKGTNTIAYSYDGLSWIGLGTSIFTIAGNDVAWNGTIWVAVGTGTNTLAYSYDGITWNPIIAVSVQNITELIGISWNGNIWLAVGGFGTTATSTDGITWTVTTTNTLNYAIKRAAWDGSKWVAAGTGNAGYCFATSTNGINWNGIKSTTVGNVYNGFSGGANDIAWNGRRWTAVGDGPMPIMTSLFGSTGWTGVTGRTGSVLTRPGRGITWNDNMWVAVGGTGPVERNLPNPLNNPINFSYDGIYWNNLPGQTGGATGFNPFNYGNRVASNSKIGPVVVNSAINLNNRQNSNQLSFSLPNIVNNNTGINKNLSVTVMADWYGYN
jgi:hypothetical protein